MNWKLLFFSLTFTLANIICAPIDAPACSLDDTECLKNLITTLAKDMVPGNKEIGLPSSDPIFFKRIEGNMNSLKYVLTDSTLTGDSNFDIKSVTITPDGKTGVIQIVFPKLRISGQYVMNGTAAGFPISGNGDYFVETYNFLTTLTGELKRSKGSDGKIHLSFKNFKVDAELMDGFDFDLTNVFDGNKQTADAFKAVVKENWKLIAKEYQGPIVEANAREFLKNMNIYLKTIPIEKILKA